MTFMSITGGVGCYLRFDIRKGIGRSTIDCMLQSGLEVRDWMLLEGH